MSRKRAAEVDQALPGAPALALVIMTPGLLSFEQAAQYLNVKVETLRCWVYREHRLPLIRYADLRNPAKRGVLRLRKADLDAYIERCTIPAHDVAAARYRPRRQA